MKPYPWEADLEHLYQAFKRRLAEEATLNIWPTQENNDKTKTDK